MCSFTGDNFSPWPCGTSQSKGRVQIDGGKIPRADRTSVHREGGHLPASDVKVRTTGGDAMGAVTTTLAAE